MGKKAKWTMKQFREICSLKNIICLSRKYNHNSMKFQCKVCGHRWTARPEDIATCVHPETRGGCPICYGRNVRAEAAFAKAEKIAEERDWDLLSTSADYINAHSLLHWRCRKCGREWHAALSDVQDKPKRKGTGCPGCGSSGRPRMNFNELKKMAEFFGVVCLSTAYKNCSSLLQWQCKTREHIFERTADQYDKRPWCPHCRETGIITTAEMEKKKLEYLKMIHNRAESDAKQAVPFVMPVEPSGDVVSTASEYTASKKVKRDKISTTPTKNPKRAEAQILHNKIVLPVKLQSDRRLHDSARKFGVFCPLCLSPLTFSPHQNNNGEYMVQCTSMRSNGNGHCTYKIYLDRAAYNLFLTQNFDALCKLINNISYILCDKCGSPVYEKNTSCVKCADAKMTDGLTSDIKPAEHSFEEPGDGPF